MYLREKTVNSGCQFANSLMANDCMHVDVFLKSKNVDSISRWIFNSSKIQIYDIAIIFTQACIMINLKP